MKGIKLFASTSSDQSQNSAYLFVSPALISTAKSFFRRHGIRFLQQWPHDGVTSKFPSLAVIKKHLFTSFLLSVSLLSFRCQTYQRTGGKSTGLCLTKANHACLYASMSIWGTAEVWQSAREWSTILKCLHPNTVSLNTLCDKFGENLYLLYHWLIPPRLLLLHLSPATFPYISLLLVSMDTIKHAKNTAKRDHDPCLLPRGSYAWAQRHGSWYRTIQFNSLEWDMRAMAKNAAYKPNRHRICFQLKALAIFECFPMWFISYLIKSDGIYTRNVPIFLCCK